MDGKAADLITWRAYVAAVVSPYRPFQGTGKQVPVAQVGRTFEFAQNSSQDRALAVYAVRQDIAGGGLLIQASLSSIPGGTDPVYTFLGQGASPLLARQLFILKPQETLYGTVQATTPGAILVVRSEFF